MIKKLGYLGLAFGFFFVLQQNTEAQTPGYPIIALQSGKYDFFKYDQTQIRTQYLDIIKQRSQEDRAFFEQTVTNLENAFIELFTNEVLALKSFSDNAVATQQATSAKDFLQAINNYTKASLILQTKINNLQAITQAFPSLQLIDDKGKRAGEVPAYRALNIKPLVTYYTDKLTQQTEWLSDLKHIIKIQRSIDGEPELVNGQPTYETITIPAGSHKGLVLESKFALLSPTALKKMMARVKTLRSIDFEQLKNFQSFTTAYKQRIQTFLKNYGTTEYYRSLSAAQQTDRDNEVAEIEKVSYQRSYLRASFGVPICAVGVIYDNQKIFNLDNLMTTVKDLRFTQTPACDVNDQLTVKKAYTNWITQIDPRSKDLFDGNLTFVETAANLFTWVRGEKNLTMAAQAVLKYLAYDLNEDLLIQDSGGVESLMAFCAKRYKSNPKDIARFAALKKSTDDDMNGGRVLSSNSMQSYLYNAWISAENLADNFAEAEVVQDEINNNRAVESAFNKAKDSRKKKF